MRHPVTSEVAFNAAIAVVVTIDVAEKSQGGGNGEVARLPEQQASAHAWLVGHLPSTLMDDTEHDLENYAIHIIWNAPNYSWGDFIELCWSHSIAARTPITSRSAQWCW